MFLFSHPPPFRSSFTSTSSLLSHWLQCSTGEPGPRLLPLFFPVMESTEFGRSFPCRVDSASRAAAILLRTSGGRFVEVSVIKASILCSRCCMGINLVANKSFEKYLSKTRNQTGNILYHRIAS